MKSKLLFILPLILLLATACGKDEEKDTEKPVIDMSSPEAFPQPCDTVFIGEAFLFKAIFTDNAEFGSYNLELHHNFDHHTHGSHSETCLFDPVKAPVNPFYYNESFTIPAGNLTFSAEREIVIPQGKDAGDYHFVVKLTDKEGWQSWQSVSVKLSIRD
jgi:hypothetical protein